MENVNIKAGAIGGLVGGVVFGMLMGMMGMLPMVGMLFGSDSAVIGFIIHLVISAITGVAFAIAFGSKVKSMAGGAEWGLVYGVIWWFLGPLIIMPVWLGMGLMLSAEGMKGAMPSLVGHIIFGVLLGTYYSWAVSKDSGANASEAPVRDVSGDGAPGGIS